MNCRVIKEMYRTKQSKTKKKKKTEKDNYLELLSGSESKRVIVVVKRNIGLRESANVMRYHSQSGIFSWMGGMHN